VSIFGTAVFKAELPSASRFFHDAGRRGFQLLIACSNIAHMLPARTSDRQKAFVLACRGAHWI
jgi:hypothetical protein